MINADCNGAVNIGRKSKQNGFTGLSRGCESAAIKNQGLLRFCPLKNPRPFYGGECQYDGIEDGITDELVASGVPKDRIVLAFHPPEVRQHTGYARA